MSRVRHLVGCFVIPGAMLLAACQQPTLRAEKPQPTLPATSEPTPTNVAERPQVAVSSADVSALIGEQSAALSTLRVGIDGSLDRGFASALGTRSVRGRRLGGGGYQPSPGELKLDRILAETSGYLRFKKLLNPDDELESRASAHFVIDYARTTNKRVEYLGTETRTFHGFEMGVSLVLLDATGKEVFRTATDRRRTLICVGNEGSGQQCYGDRRGIVSSVDQDETWRQLIRSTLSDAVDQAYTEVGEWAGLLATLKDRIVVERRGQQFETEVTGAGLRNLGTRHSRYLFLDTHSLLGAERLVRDLRDRGATLDERESRLLERQYLSAYRTGLDEGLRGALDKSRKIRQVGVFMLPDIDAQWFRDAYARLKADAINNDELEVVVTDSGERIEWPDRLKQYGQFCTARGAMGRGNRCMTVSPLYKAAETIEKGYLAQDRARDFAFVTQIITTASAVVDPMLQLAGCKNRDCYFPASVPIDQRFDVVIEESPQYIRFKKVRANQNEDDLYLRQTAFDAYRKLGHQAALKVVATFEEIMRD